MNKFQNKYRIPSARLQGYDYGQKGAYFITICTHERINYFGEIVNDEMQLNELGQMAEKYWWEIPVHFSFIELGEFVVMPNHVHGILIIDKTENDVETRLIASLPNSGGITGPHNPMFHDNISRIIRWYKGRCSFEIRKIHADFAWQTRFHDHIIRNRKSFEIIERYIVTNPKNWKEDKFYS